MKSLLLRAGLLTCLSLGLFYEGASAESSDWASKCSYLGEIKPNQNPSYQQINCLLTNAALDANIPPEVVKAVATKESDWRQFNADGTPYKSLTDPGLGIMQITNKPNYAEEKLTNDIVYNIQAGVEILSEMYDYNHLPKIKGAGRDIIENWYFPVMAYNGIKPKNSPLYKATGGKNEKAYQEEVFVHIEEQSYLNEEPYVNGPKLAQFPFTTGDFEYDPNSSQNINFLKKEYILTGQLHPSSYHFKAGNKVIVSENQVKLRKDASTAQVEITQLPINTTLVITGEFSYDSKSDVHQFVWYPVKTENGLEGFISSAYLMKKVEPPAVNPLDDRSTAISGKAESNTKVYAMVDGNKIGEATATNGVYTIKIPKQKAGTSISVYAIDPTGNTSASTTVIVEDKTAPSTPIVNPVYDNATLVTGKAETNAKIFAKVGSKLLGQTIAKNGKYTVKIPKQKAGTTIVIYAVDTFGNISASKSVDVTDRTPPIVPTVNKITSKSTAVTGKGEIGVSIIIYNGSKKIGEGIVDSRGNFNVKIKVQKKGSAIKVYAKDKAGYKSSKKITVN